MTPLAEAVAGEWRAQGETIERAGMGLTRLVSTALDRMPALRGAAIDEADEFLFERSELPRVALKQQR